MTNSERDDNENDDSNDSGNEEMSGIHIDVGLSVNSILRGLLGGLRSRDDRGPLGSRPGPRPSGPGSPSRESQPAASGEPEPETEGAYHVETRREGNQLTVVCDLLGVDPADVEAGIGERTGDLVIAVDDEVVERVSLSGEPFEVREARFNNGVLRVTLRAVGHNSV
jgi:HSP20 family molecular chaperone IbpA